MSEKIIELSFSTINNCLQPDNSHNWINKMRGLEPEDRAYYRAGKKVHRIIQDHVSRIRTDDRLKHIFFKFPIVETKEKDEKCKFSRFVTKGYRIIGYADGLNYEEANYLEVKSGDPPWSLGRFQKSMQRKIHAFALPKLKKAILITCSKDPKNWKNHPAKVYPVPLTEKDREEALAWILEAVKTIKKGDFTGGLDENGKCTDRWCYYGRNCSFK